MWRSLTSFKWCCSGKAFNEASDNLIQSKHVRFAAGIFLQSLRLLQFLKIGLLKDFTRLPEQQTTCKFIKKETPAHVFSCEFCRISKTSNTFFYRTLPNGCFSTVIVRRLNFQTISIIKQIFTKQYKNSW